MCGGPGKILVPCAFGCSNRLLHGIRHLLKCIADEGFLQFCRFTGLNEVPIGDVDDSIMAAGADRQGQFHLFVFDLVRIEAWLHGEDILQWRQIIAAART